MLIEAELKARLADPDVVRAALEALAEGERATYRDTYFDTEDGVLERTGRELRLRTVEWADSVRHLLTVKEPVVDPVSGSKPEHEMDVAAPDAVVSMLRALGYAPVLHFTKECENYRFVNGAREFLASVVRLPEIDGTFLEVETMADMSDVEPAITAVRTVLDRLGVDPSTLTTALYTDAVRAVRGR